MQEILGLAALADDPQGKSEQSRAVTLVQCRQSCAITGGHRRDEYLVVGVVGRRGGSHALVRLARLSSPVVAC
ncbi:MAG TPA: hypothetical protein VK601_27205 [Kofleriaceae bacterium]|nr:hypothetical protein [Kofleriaceae bacterium]